MSRLAEMVSFYAPAPGQFLALAGVLLVAAAMAVIGAAFGGRHRLPEADLPVGWAVVSGLFVVLGAGLDLSLTLVSGVAGVTALGAVAVLVRRRQWPGDRGVWLALAAMAPLMAATASMAPSQWDEFTQWLPNARYLVMFDHFPNGCRIASDSVFPNYPPALTVIYLLVARLSGHYLDGVAPWFNLLLLAMAARLVARLFRGDGQASAPVAVWGVLAVTLLGTTFVPKLVLSGYADTATAVAVAFAAVLGLEAVRASRIRAEPEDPGVKPMPARNRGVLVQFAAVFALLPMTKQGNFALMALLAGSLGLVALLNGEAVARVARRLGLAMVPTVAVILAWRLHVIAGLGELSIRAPGNWEWGLLGPMLVSMKNVALSKGGYFGFGLGLLALVPWLGRRLPVVTVFALCFVGYTVFLVFVYLAVLSDYESANAASYWRYNTHLGVLQMAALAAVLGWVARVRPMPRLGRPLAMLGVAALVAAPWAAVKYVRFDLNPAKNSAAQVIGEIGRLLPPGERLAVVDARGTGFYAHYADYLLGFGLQVASRVSVFEASQAAVILADTPARYLWLRSQGQDAMATLELAADPGASHLLRRDAEGWTVIRSWPFPPGVDPAAEKD